MKVKELIEQLKEADMDAEVYLQIDPEGNGYRVVNGADCNAVVTCADEYKTPEDVYDADWTADDCCLDEETWEELKALPRSVIIFP